MIPTFKINRAINIGTAVFVVEGEKDEHDLVSAIFCNVYGYTVLKRTTTPMSLTILEDGNNNKVVIVSAEKSSMETIDRFEGYNDQIYSVLWEKHQIDLTNAPVFYIWDRDRHNNPERVVDALIEKLYSPLDNGYYENGLLLLSYPCIESYLITCYEDKTKFETDEEPKKYIKKNRYSANRLHDDEIIHAVALLWNNTVESGILRYDLDHYLDDFHDANRSINDYEKQYYSSNEQYRILSLLSISLLYLGLIIKDEGA